MPFNSYITEGVKNKIRRKNKKAIIFCIKPLGEEVINPSFT
ncbi:hypothetical protein [Clostridium algoriphilum]|nr:hypothetical protein [Clostridium algoriphilum]